MRMRTGCARTVGMDTNAPASPGVVCGQGSAGRNGVPIPAGSRRLQGALWAFIGPGEPRRPAPAGSGRLRPFSALKILTRLL